MNTIKAAAYVAAICRSAAMPNAGIYEFEGPVAKLVGVEDCFLYETQVSSPQLLAIAKRREYDGYLAACELAKRSGDYAFANMMFARALDFLFVDKKPTTYAKYLAYVETNGESYYDLLNLVIADDENNHVLSVCVPIPMLSSFVQCWTKELPTIARREHRRKVTSHGVAYKYATKDTLEECLEALRIYFSPTQNTPLEECSEVFEISFNPDQE